MTLLAQAPWAALLSILLAGGDPGVSTGSTNPWGGGTSRGESRPLDTRGQGESRPQGEHFKEGAAWCGPIPGGQAGSPPPPPPFMLGTECPVSQSSPLGPDPKKASKPRSPSPPPPEKSHQTSHDP